MNRIRSLVAAVVLAAFLSPAALPQASAAEPPSTGTVFAASSYWTGFTEFWTGSFKKQNGVVLFVLGLGAVSLFIITRSRLKK